MAITPTVLNSDYVTAITTHSERIIDLTPIVYYKLNDGNTTATDSGPNDYNGTITIGSGAYNAVTTPTGQTCLWFDGSATVVTPPSDVRTAITDPGVLTISFWCSLPNWLSLWTSTIGGSKRDMFYMDGVTGATNSVEFSKAAADRRWDLGLTLTPSNRSLQKNFTQAVGHHAWYHWVIVLDSDNDETTMYINGALEARDDMNASTWTASGPQITEMFIGAGNGGTANYWHGAIADFAIFDRALTSDEAVSLYVTGLQLSETGEDWVTWPRTMNNGTTAATNLANLQTALDATSAGDVVFVRGATYGSSGTDQVDIDTTAGSANSPVVIAQYPGETAIINATTNVDVDYVWLWGMEHKSGTNTSGLATIHTNQDGSGTSTGLRILNSYLHTNNNQPAINLDDTNDAGDHVLSGTIANASSGTGTHALTARNTPTEGTKYIHGNGFNDAANGTSASNIDAAETVSGTAHGAFDVRYNGAANGDVVFEGNAVTMSDVTINDNVFYKGIFSVGSGCWHSATVKDNHIFADVEANAPEFYWPDITADLFPDFRGNTFHQVTENVDALQLFNVDSAYATGSSSAWGYGKINDNTYSRPYRVDVEGNNANSVPDLQAVWSSLNRGPARGGYDSESTETFKTANEAYIYRSPVDRAWALLYLINYTGGSTEDVILSYGFSWSVHSYNDVNGTAVDTGAAGQSFGATGLSEGVTMYVIKFTV